MPAACHTSVNPPLLLLKSFLSQQGHRRSEVYLPESCPVNSGIDTLPPPPTSPLPLCQVETVLVFVF